MTDVPSGDGIPAFNPAASVPPGVASSQPPSDTIPPWALKIAGTILFPIAIGLPAWIFGNLHARLDKAEDVQQELELRDVQHEHEIESQKDQTRRQWELLSATQKELAELKGRIDRIKGSNPDGD